MRNEEKSRDRLLTELNDLQERVAGYEKLAAQHSNLEEPLREAEQKYRTILEYTGSATVIVEDDMTISFVNEEFERLSGYTKEEVEGQKTWKDFVANDDPDKISDHDQRRHGQSDTLLGSDKFTFVAKDGTRRSILPTVGLLPNTNQRVASLLDVTEYTRAQAELRMVNRALDTLSSCNQTLVSATNESELVNEICRNIVNVGYRLAWVGYAQDDEGKNVTPVAQAGFEDAYLETAQITWANTERGQGPTGTAIRTGKPSIVRHILTDPNFEPWRAEAVKRGYASSAAIPLISQNKTFGALNIYSPEPDAFSSRELELLTELANDLAYGITMLRSRSEHRRMRSELKRTEEQYRVVVDNANEAILVLQDGTIRFFNPKLLEISGYTSEEVISTSFMEFIHPEDKSEVELYYQEGLRGEGHPIVRSFRFIAANGEHKWVTTNTALIGWEGRPAVLLFLIDITPQKILERQLLQAQKMETVGKLAGGVAHDFNNVLTIISGFSEILLNKLAPSTLAQPEIENIKQATQRAASLTRQLVAFSRGQTMPPRVIDLNTLVEGLKKMLERLIGDDIKLVTTLEAEVAKIWVDPGQIEQVIMNLAVNARDAIPNGGTLHIETTNTSLEGDFVQEHPEVVPGEYVMLTVVDGGMGMDQETMTNMFEPFFTTKEQGKGTGLGLPITYRIVKHSGGYIYADSERGKGTTFRIYLPPATDEDTVEETFTLGAEGPATGTETILVVEDEQDVAKVIRTALELHGYSVLEAPDGETAIEVAGAHVGEIHLVVLDAVLPGMTGSDTALQLRELVPHIRTLYVSGYTDDTRVLNLIRSQDAFMLQKPFESKTLLRRVRDILDKVPE